MKIIVNADNKTRHKVLNLFFFLDGHLCVVMELLTVLQVLFLRCVFSLTQAVFCTLRRTDWLFVFCSGKSSMDSQPFKH